MCYIWYILKLANVSNLISKYIFYYKGFAMTSNITCKWKATYLKIAIHIRLFTDDIPKNIINIKWNRTKTSIDTQTDGKKVKLLERERQREIEKRAFINGFMH